MGIEGVDVEEMGSVHDVLQVRQLADGDVEEVRMLSDCDSSVMLCRHVIIDNGGAGGGVVVAEEAVEKTVMVHHQVHASTGSAKTGGVLATM